MIHTFAPFAAWPYPFSRSPPPFRRPPTFTLLMVSAVGSLKAAALPARTRLKSVLYS